MKLGVLFSGGKDSVFAMYKAMHDHEISCLITIHSENSESYMFHTPNIHLVGAQAKAMDVPIIIEKTKGVKEKELLDLKKAIKKAIDKYQIKGIVTGAIKSVYQASRVQKICNDLKIHCFNPLWQSDEFGYLYELINSGFKTIIVGVFGYPLTEDFLGMEIDNNFEDKMIQLNEKYQISPVGEGGEFETFVYDGPTFNKEIKIVESSKEFKDNCGNMYIKKIK
jgi:diphthine-ammonia ligase